MQYNTENRRFSNFTIKGNEGTYKVCLDPIIRRLEN